MTQDKKESESLEKAHRDLIVNKSSSLVKRALDDLARLKAQPPSGPEHQTDLPKKRQIRVVIGNFEKNAINDLLSNLIKAVINDKYTLTIKSVSYGEELLDIAENAEADIFIMIVNNIYFRSFYPPKERIEKSVQLITQINRAFDKPVIVFSPAEIELEGVISITFQGIVKQTGADFYLPFSALLGSFDDIKMAFEKCIYEVLRRAS